MQQPSEDPRVGEIYTAFGKTLKCVSPTVFTWFDNGEDFIGWIIETPAKWVRADAETTIEEGLVNRKIRELRETDGGKQYPLFTGMTDEQILAWVFETFWNSPAMGN